MSEPCKLLLDVGNTHIKYAYLRTEQGIADLQVMRSSIDEIETLIDGVQQVLLSYVAHDDNKQIIAKLCSNAEIPLHIVGTLKQQFGIQNAYRQVTNMGSDRWMAIVAACALYDQGLRNNLLVIDAGTAITCDFVIANQHLGGWIAPGLQMARNAVVNSTSRVFDAQIDQVDISLGKDTPECLAYGAFAQLAGMVCEAIKIMQVELQKISSKSTNKFEIFISGGDAPLLVKTISESKSSKLNYNINYIENLVLVGLAKVAREPDNNNAVF